MTAALAVVAGLVVAAVLVVLVRRPIWAVAAWVLVEVLNAGEVLSGITGTSIANPAMALAVASVGLALWSRWRRGELRRPEGDLRSGLLVVGLGVLFLVAQLPALLLNGETASLLELAPDLVRSFFFFALVVLTGTFLASPWLLVKVFVAALGVLGGYTFLDFVLLGGSQPLLGFAVVSDALGEGAVTPRYSGPLNDPNVWGRALVLAVPFGVSLTVLAAQDRRWRPAGAWALLTVGLLLGTYLTQSRGAMLALGLAALVWWWLSGPKPRAARIAVPVGGLAFLAVPGVGSRIFSLDQLFGGAQVTDYALVERSAAQRVALETFRDHPLLGVGDPGLYFLQYAQYADIVLRRQVAPHNLYLQLASAGGVVLLLTWVCLVAAAVLVGIRTSIASRHLDPSGRAGAERLLAAAVASSLAGWTVCSLFLHMIYPRHVLLVLGVAATLALTTRTRPLTRQELDPGAGRRAQLLLVRAAVVSMVLGLAMLLAPSLTRVTTWTATVTVPVLPQASTAGDVVDGYQYDVVTRDVVLPTYAAVFADIVPVSDQEGVEVSATGDAEEAIVTIQVRAPQEEVALYLARRVASEGGAFLNAQPALSTLAVARPGPAVSAQVAELDERRLLALLGGALGLGVLVSLHPAWRRLADSDTTAPDGSRADEGQPLAPSSR